MQVFPLPQGSFYESSGYRTHERPTHNGIDYAAPEETPLFACVDGTVLVPAFEPGGAGNNIWIKADDGDVLYKYFHMGHVSVVTGQHVTAGEIVGAVGHTGGVVPPGPNGAHLHLERHEGEGDWPASNWTDPTDECTHCIESGHFPTSHLPPEEPMTDDDKQFITDQLEAFEGRVNQRMEQLGGGVVQDDANVAQLVHQDLDVIASRLGVGPLPDFTVNRPADYVQASGQEHHVVQGEHVQGGE